MSSQGKKNGSKNNGKKSSRPPASASSKTPRPSQITPTEAAAEMAPELADVEPVASPEAASPPDAPAETAAPAPPALAPPALRLERLSDGIAVVTIDVPGQSQNTLHARFTEEFAELCAGLEAGVADGSLTGVVLRSGKADGFLAGADLEMLRGVSDAAAATRLSQSGQAAMQRFAELSERVEVVAAIHGPCLGGGLELALACSSRVASDDKKTTLGLPEVMLGLVPGAGGTQRLPRLVGIQAALDLILTGKQLKPAAALRLGLVDEVVPQAILFEVALERARAGRRRPQPSSPLAELKNRLTSTRALKRLVLEENPLGRRILFREARKALLRKTRGHYPAPLRALEAIEAGYERGLADGYDAESRAFGGLLVGSEARSLLEIFRATQALKKDPGTDGTGESARPIGKLGVLGAGLMGAGIAYVSTAVAGIPVRLKDRDDVSLGRGLRVIRELLDERVGRRSLTRRQASEQLAQIHPTLNAAGFADCPLVIEAVFEDLELKHRVLREVEATGPREVIFASNTSSIPITRIAAASAHPETVIGMHYFSPVHRMPLLEIIVTERTAPWVVETCVALGKRQGKTVIVVRDGVGFYTSRILAPYMNEAAQLLAEGVPVETIDEALLDFGFPIGPFALIDEVGIDVAAKVGPILRAAFGDRLAPPAGFQALVESGRQGKKNRRGFYLYDEGAKRSDGKRRVDPTVYAELGLAAPSPGQPRSPSSQDASQRLDIQLRCALQLVNEAAHCLGEGILRSPRDGDIGAIFGLGFPPFLGGPFRWADQLGAAAVVERLSGYQEKHGPRFAPAPLLVELAQAGRRFHPE